MNTNTRLDLLAEQHGLAVDQELIAKAREVLRNSLSPATVLGQDARFSVFEGWCRDNNRCALPADKATVTTFFLATMGRYTAGSMEGLRATIKMRHLRSGLADPTTSDIVKAKIDERRRELGDPKKKILYLEDLIAAVNSIGASSIRDLRDRALLLTAYLTPLRVSAIEALCREHILFRANDMLLYLRDDRVISLPRMRNEWPCPVAAMHLYLKTAEITSGPVFIGCKGKRPSRQFAMGSGRLGKIVRRHCKAAGLPDSNEYVAASLFSGFVVSGYEADMRITDLMVRANLNERAVQRYARYRRRQSSTSLIAYVGM